MNRRLNNWIELESWLDSLGMFHMELDLARMRKAVNLAGLDKAAFTAVQVLGTNGKGSTSTFIAALGKEAGLKTGLFSSPHFISPRERILLNGEKFSKEQWLEAANTLLAQLGKNIRPTYFEFLTLLALRLFRDSGVQLAIFEAGLGGRHDATSALPIRLCCFTPIALDHEAIIGPGLEAIAWNKADALSTGQIAISCRQFPKVMEILKKKAASLGIKLQICETAPDEDLNRLGLKGSWQRNNASLALAVWRELVQQLALSDDRKRDRKALGQAFIAGRMQMVSGSPTHPPFLLDGGHNPHALRALASEIVKTPPRCLIFSALKDKNWKDGLALLARITGKTPIFIPQLSESRAEKAANMAKWLNSIWPGRAKAIDGPYSMLQSLGMAAALSANSEEPVLICGSLFLLGSFYRLFPQYLETTEKKHDRE